MIFSFSKSPVTGQMVIYINIIDIQTEVVHVYVCQPPSSQSHIQPRRKKTLRLTNVSQG